MHNSLLVSKTIKILMHHITYQIYISIPCGYWLSVNWYMLFRTHNWYNELSDFAGRYISLSSTGDERVNVNPSLGTLHTLFVREHNRIAEKLKCLNPDWKGFKVFQETRKIISALMQHITYKEYLPVVLGPEVMSAYNLDVLDSGFSDGVYDSDTNAGIANVFSTAAFRFGHSAIPNVQGFTKESGKTRKISLEKTFHRPWFLQERGGKGFLENARWVVSSSQPKSDGSVIKNISIWGNTIVTLYDT